MRFRSIQIARAAAALVVVLFHSHFAVNSFSDDYKISLPFIYQWGYLGVDLFFVISGFVIAHVLSRPNFLLSEFLIKRVFRIYPLFWAFALFAIYAKSTGWLHLGGNSMDAIVPSLLLLPQADHPVYAVAWTLEHELIFYILSGVLWWLRGSLAALYGFFFLTSVAGYMDSYVLGTKLFDDAWSSHLFSPHNFAFALGLLAYRYRHFATARSPSFWMLGAVTGHYIAIQLMGSRVPEIRPIARFVLAPGALALIVASLLAAEPLLEKAKGSFLVQGGVWLGNISYSLYLMHWWLVLESGRMKYKVLTDRPDWIAEGWRAGVVLLAVALSYLTYRVIERPCIRLGNTLSAKIKSFTGSASAPENMIR